MFTNKQMSNRLLRTKLILIVSLALGAAFPLAPAKASDFDQAMKKNQQLLRMAVRDFEGRFSSAKALILFNVREDGTLADIKAYRRYNGLCAEVAPTEKDFEQLELKLISQLKSRQPLNYCPWQNRHDIPVLLLLIYDARANPRVSLDFFWTMVQFQSREKNVLSPVSGGSIAESSEIVPVFVPRPDNPTFPGKGSRENWSKACIFYGLGLADSANNFSKSIQNLKKAISKYPWDERFYRALGAAYVRNEDFEEAIRWYKAGMAIAARDKQVVYQNLILSAQKHTKVDH